MNQPSACTRDVQVQTGERVIMHTHGALKLVLQNFGQVDVSKEKLLLSLSSEGIALQLSASSQKVIFHVLKKDQQARQVSARETTVETTFTLEALQEDQYSKPQIVNPVVSFEKLIFKLDGGDLTQLQLALDLGHLGISSLATPDADAASWIDQDVDAAFVKALGGQQYEIDFADLNADPLDSESFDIVLKLGIKKAFPVN